MMNDSMGGVMCTREQGKTIRETYLKYKGGKAVDKEDLEVLDILSDASRIEFYFKNGVVYAKAVVY